MIRLRLTFFIAILGAMIVFIVLPMNVRAQDVPQRTETPKPPKKKRIKQKKFKGDRARSNRKQLRQTRFKTKNRQGDRGVKGDITGRKYRSRKTPRRTYARPQPDPYAGRRTRDREVDRAGPEPPPTFRESPRGEKARRGDITGKRRIRTKSASSTRARTYPRRDPYAGREQRSAERAQRIRKAQVFNRSASRSGERRRTFSVARPQTASGTARIRKSKNAYAGKGTRRGETATNRDISGRKLRTRNVDSTPKVPRGGYAPTDTYYGRKTGREGRRFSQRAMQQGQAPSISRGGEQPGKRYSEPGMKNYQSPRPRTTGPSFDPYAGRKKGGEGQRFPDRRKPKVRTASRKGERRMQVQAVVPNSVSGQRKIKKSKDPYAGRERRRGERASDRDIAGRKLRTKGYESPRPQWGQAIRRPDTYYGRQDRGDRPARTQGIAKGAGSISGRIWNNQGLPIGAKPPSVATQQATQFKGRFRPFELKPGYGDNQAIGKYKGRFRPYELNPGYGDSRAIGKYKGRFRPYELNPGYGDNRAIGKYKGRFRPYELNPGYGDSRAIGKYKGRFRPYELNPGYGDSRAIGKYKGRFRPYELNPGYSDNKAISNYKGRFRPYELNPGYGDTRAIGKYKGRFRPYELNPGYGDSRAIGKYKGRFRPYELNPGYGDNRAIGKYKGRFRPYELNPGYGDSRAIGKYKGRFRPYELNPGYSDNRAIGKYKGRFRPYELNPGYSNDKAISKYKGRFRPFELQPGYSDERRIARWQGNIKGSKPLKGGGSISGQFWNNDEQSLTQQAGAAPGSTFQGNLKVQRPLKGAGGSISGQFWNNDDQPLTQQRGAAPGSTFQGNLKGQKPLKGAGGSISGQLWNNDDTPVAQQQGAGPGSQFQGNLKASQYKPAQSEGTEYGRAKSVIFITPQKAKNYKAFVNTTGSDKPSRSEGTKYGQTRKFFFLPPKSGSLESTSITKKEKSEDFNYGRTQSLFFLTPAKAKNYKGYVSKDPAVFDLFTSRKQMHPSYNYTQGDAKNGKDEKEKTFKFKVWWAKIFGANGNQPQNLKDSDKKPRYDKRESGIWYE